MKGGARNSVSQNYYQDYIVQNHHNFRFAHNLSEDDNTSVLFIFIHSFIHIQTHTGPHTQNVQSCLLTILNAHISVDSVFTIHERKSYYVHTVCVYMDTRCSYMHIRVVHLSERYSFYVYFLCFTLF